MVIDEGRAALADGAEASGRIDAPGANSIVSGQKQMSSARGGQGFFVVAFTLERDRSRADPALEEAARWRARDEGGIANVPATSTMRWVAASM